MNKKLFISYSHEDKEFVEWLKDNLQGLGLEIWYDQQELQLGDSIKGKISEGGIRGRSSDFSIDTQSRL